MARRRSNQSRLTRDPVRLQMAVGGLAGLALGYFATGRVWPMLGTSVAGAVLVPLIGGASAAELKQAAIGVGGRGVRGR